MYLLLRATEQNIIYNGPFAGSGHIVRNKLHWDANNALGLPKQRNSFTSTARLSFVLEVPLRHLRPSVIYSVPCDRILQRAYWNSKLNCYSNQHKTHIVTKLAN